LISQLAHNGIPQATSRSHNWANICCGSGADRAPSISHSATALISALGIAPELDRFYTEAHITWVEPVWGAI